MPLQTKHLPYCLVLATSLAASSAANAQAATVNPYLAAKTYALTHVDPAQSDVAPYPLKRGTFNIDLAKQAHVYGGPVNIMTLQSTDPNHMWGVSSGGVTYIDATNGGFKEVARANAPTVKVVTDAQLDSILNRTYTDLDQIRSAFSGELGIDQTRIPNGIYCLVDKDNHVYYNTANGQVVVYALKDANNPAAGIQVISQRDLRKDVLTANLGFDGHEGIMGLNMTYDGKLIVLGNNSVSIVDRSLQGPVQTVRLEPNEFVSNAMAVDEHNGIYFASDKQMHKVVWTGSTLSNDAKDGAWAAPYDTGAQMPTVKFGTGTGSTPTLMGFGDDADQLVVITDGANRMKLVAFWRNQIPGGAKPVPGAKSPRIADQFPVTAGLSPLPPYIQSEQSVVVKGYGAFVVNNIAAKGDKDKYVDVMSLGPIDKPATGAQRIDWDPKTHQWKSKWTNPTAISTSMAPTMSGTSDIVMVNGFHEGSGWEMSGLDWNTGKVVYRAIFGKTNWGNGAYAQPQLFPNGDLLFNSIGGPFRVQNK